MISFFKKKTSYKKKFVVSVLVAYLFVGGVSWYLDKAWAAPGLCAHDQEVCVKEGSSLKEIAFLLEKKNIITCPRIFIFLIYLAGESKKLRSGEYVIPAHSSIKEILQCFTTSVHVVLHNLTIPEGLTSWQVLRLLEKNPLLDGPLPHTVPAEGSLLADTIKIERHATRDSVLRFLQEKQQGLVRQIWENRDKTLPLKTKEELVILASLIEKETAQPEERGLVAGVFYNRLQKHMRLQSDPTVLYGLFGGPGKPKERPIFRSDLVKDTPYNTYIIAGLPPTPIANPGEAALRAAAHPTSTKALYFVANGQGGHVFSETLKEHQEQVKKWRQVEDTHKYWRDNP